jgi:hypothetical protein
MARETLNARFERLRRSKQGPRKNGVRRERVRDVLALLGRDHGDLVDAVWALLDDTLPSQFPPLAETHRFSDGASTAHIGCHVGILQRGTGKLDREGRDYWIKPLREIGAFEPITLPRGANEFVSGHVVSKSPYSGYRLAADFLALLRSPASELSRKVQKWASADAIRDRLALQARAAEAAKRAINNDHEELIRSVQGTYVPLFLPGFRVVLVDAGDGERITQEKRRSLAQIGMTLDLSDAYPDVLLFKEDDRAVWCVEAVTSDGEVDAHKVAAVEKRCDASGLTLAGMTTAYTTRKDWLRRQERVQNLAPNTLVWTADDPGVQYRIELPGAPCRPETPSKR